MLAPRLMTLNDLDLLQENFMGFRRFWREQLLSKWR